MKRTIELTVNGDTHTAIIDARETLLDSLRYKPGLHGSQGGLRETATAEPAPSS